MSLEKKKKNISEIVYLIFLSLVLFRHFLLNTLVEYQWIMNGVQAIMFLLGLCIIVKIVAGWNKSWSCYDTFFAILTVGFLAIANFYMKNHFVWEYLLLIMGARNVDRKKIVKTYLCVIVPLLILIVGASLLGIIENRIFYRNSEYDVQRYAMGFVYVTDFCAHLFFICASYAYLRGKKIHSFEILGIALVGVLCYTLSEGRNSTICIGLLVLLLIIIKIKDALNKNKESKEHKLLNILFSWFMPALAVCSILLGVFYNGSNSIMKTLNSVMGGRPAMDHSALSKFNVTLLGQNFNESIIGTDSINGKSSNYFFIDCSYVSILLKMGILALIAIIIIWMTITYRECKKLNYLEAGVLCVVAFHCFMEHNILNVSYNPFLLLLFAGGALEYFKFERLTNWIKSKFNPRVVKNCLSLALFSVIVEILAFNLQSLTSMFKSFVEVTNFELTLSGATPIGDKAYFCDEITTLKIENVDEDVDNVFVSLTFYSKDGSKKLYNVEYGVFLYELDEKGKPIEIGNRRVKSDTPSSGFIELDRTHKDGNYAMGFSFGEDCYVEFNTIAINSAKPFNVSYIRLLIIYVLMVCIYYFGIERRNAELSETTIEVHKEVLDQFESTGALRTDKHRNMQAVYDKKSPVYIFLKRAFDIICSGLAILVLSPIFIGTAIAIKIEDKGPVFFVQKRAGKNLKPFKMWKFRSMYVNADEKLKEMLATNEQTGHAFKMKNDPRITKVGKFIRKFSIDELPQLFNIFLGDMSIVGPRPILVFQMEECDDYDKQRLIVQPGLTCIWQVSGRANIKWDQWIELDLDYIDKMSIWTDIKLIIKTVPCVLSGDGAY